MISSVISSSYQSEASALAKAIISGNADEIQKITNSSSRPSIDEIEEHFECPSNMLKAATNNIHIVKMLLDTYDTEIFVLYKNIVLADAAERGDVALLTLLLSHRSNNDISVEMKTLCLQKSIEHNHRLAVLTILHYCKNDIHDLDKNDLFYITVKSNQCEFTKILLENFNNSIQTYTKKRSLKKTVQQGNLAMLNTLLENESLLSLVTYRDNILLIEAQTRANGSPEDAAIYQPIINRLMLIPAVAELETQQAQAENLANISQLPESSMMALTKNEQALLTNLKQHYKTFYGTIGDWSKIKLDIVKYLENAYKENPALNEQGEALALEFTANLSEASNKAYYKHSIHTAWRYFSSPNLWMSPNAYNVERFNDGSGAAIISDEDKEIISYLWIALSDELVILEPNFSVEGNKNIFIETIASLARSHNRDKRPVINSEGVSVQTTEDDQMADKPSCSWGIKKSLFQAAYGHPYINCPQAQPLSPEIMLERMIERLVKRNSHKDSQANIEDKLDRLSIEPLKKIQNKLTDLFATLDLNGKEEEIKISELQVSETQLDAFIENAKLWFSVQRIEAEANPRLMPNSMGSDEYSTHLCNNYIELIKHYASNPEQAFAMHLMNEYLTQRINALNTEAANSPPPLLFSKKRTPEDQHLADSPDADLHKKQKPY